jgi:uncharacterized membrane protein HdeD (DUF308 family)
MEPRSVSSHDAAIASVAVYLRELGADDRMAHAKAADVLREARTTVVRQEPARSWWSLALRGVLAIVAGAIFLGRPIEAVTTIVLVLGAWILVDGIIAIVSSVAFRSWSTLPVGVIGALIGYLILTRTETATVVFFVLTAAWALARGAGEISMAVRMRRGEPGRGSLAFLGITSFAFGLLLLAAPVLGIVALGWWIGLYAVIYGGLSIVRAFEVHRETEDEKDLWHPHAAARPA